MMREHTLEDSVRELEQLEPLDEWMARMEESPPVPAGAPECTCELWGAASCWTCSSRANHIHIVVSGGARG